MSFSENMGKSIGKNISKTLISKFSQKLLDHAKQSATNELWTSSKRVNQKSAEGYGDLTGNKIVDIITKVSSSSPQNNLNEYDCKGTWLKKYLKKDIYLQKKDRRLLMI